jgi:hypothetical protein
MLRKGSCGVNVALETTMPVEVCKMPSPEYLIEINAIAVVDD